MRAVVRALHQGMRKADFGTVDGAIAHSLDQSQKVRILRV